MWFLAGMATGLIAGLIAALAVGAILLFWAINKTADEEVID